MKEVWRVIKEYPAYRISNYGNIKNNKTKRLLKGHNLSNGRNMVSFSVNGKSSTAKMRAKLVLQHFKKNEIDKDYALHINNNLFDCTSRNLKWGTRGDVKRMFKTIRNEVRGAYKYPHGKKNYRAIIKVEGKSKTIGYYFTKNEAQQAFINEYVRTYGYIPFVA
jgi:hypothetical protein